VRDYGGQNQINEKLKASQAFHRTLDVQKLEDVVWVQFRLENLELFNPVAQEYHRDKFLQQSTHENLITNETWWVKTGLPARTS
jgi:hypothetical protein